MRSVNTLRAALPVSEGTAQVLQEWSQQSQHRQHDASSQAAAAVPRKPAAKRRRRQLNIVPDPGSASQQGYNTAMSSATSQQNRMSGSASHSGTFPHHRQGNAKQGMRAGAKPSGTQVRSLATAEMLLAHAHLLQQLQRSNPLLSSHSSASAGQVFDAEQAHSVAVQDSSSGQTASQHTQSPTAAPDTLAQQSGTAEQDMLALQVDLVDNQLPHWSQNQPLDWSAQQDISVYQPQVGWPLPPCCGLGLIFHTMTWVLQQRMCAVSVAASLQAQMSSGYHDSYHTCNLRCQGTRVCTVSDK